MNKLFFTTSVMIGLGLSAMDHALVVPGAAASVAPASSELSPAEKSRLLSELVIAVKRGKPGQVGELLDRGADIHGEPVRERIASKPYDHGVELGRETVLFEAVWRTQSHFESYQSKRYEVVKLLLDRGGAADINTLDTNCCRGGSLLGHYALFPLEIAMMHGREDVVQLLLKHGASPNNIGCRECQRATAMHLCVTDGTSAMLAMLLKHGGRVDIKDQEKCTPLDLCFQYSRIKDVSAKMALLLDHGATFDVKNLKMAISGDAIDVLRAHRAWPDCRECREMDEKDFFAAACKGNIERLTKLLDVGLSVSLRDEQGDTALHNVAYCGDSAGIALLLGRGADINAQNTRGMTPLHCAVADNRQKAFGLLLDRGAVVDARDEHGLTPLHKAACYGHVEALRSLLSRGAAIDARDEAGRTPLQYAVQNYKEEVIEELLTRKANVLTVDNKGNTILHTAAAARDHYVMQKLFQSDARSLVNALDGEGNSPLHTALFNHDLEMARLLIDAGAKQDHCAECQERFANLCKAESELEKRIAAEHEEFVAARRREHRYREHRYMMGF